EEVADFKAASDLLKRRQQRFVQHVDRIELRVESVLGQSLDLGDFTVDRVFVKGVRDFLMGHGVFLCARSARRMTKRIALSCSDTEQTLLSTSPAASPPGISTESGR